jgi:hypothetical protein
MKRVLLLVALLTIAAAPLLGQGGGSSAVRYGPTIPYGSNTANTVFLLTNASSYPIGLYVCAKSGGCLAYTDWIAPGVFPASAIVGLTDSQALTHKDLTDSSNTFPAWINGTYVDLSSSEIYAASPAYCAGGAGVPPCANGNGHSVVGGAGLTNGLSTVTCATCNFTVNATVGQIVFATNLTQNGFTANSVIQLPQGTITVVNSNTQITVSSTASATNAAATLVWGDDETTALSNAWTATLAGCSSLQLPGVNPQGTGPAVMLVQSSEFNETTQCNAAGGNRAGLGLVGYGVNATMIVPTPNFSASSCDTSTANACFLDIFDGANLQNFQIWGGGVSNPGSAFMTKVGAVFRAANNFSAHNVQFNAWGANSTNGLGVGWLLWGGGIDIFAVNEDMFGMVGCEFLNQTNQGSTVAFNFSCYDNSLANMWVAGGSQGSTNTVYTIGGNYGGNNSGVSTPNAVQVTGGGIWYSVNDQYCLPTYCSANNAVVSIGSAKTHSGTVTGAGTATIVNGMIDAKAASGGGILNLNSSTDSLNLISTYVKSESAVGTLVNNNGVLAFDPTTQFIQTSGGTLYSGTGTRTLARQVPCPDSSGSPTAQSCATPTGFPLATGDSLQYTTTTANTGALTIAVNGGSAVTVRKWSGTVGLASGDMPANVPVTLTYDGTYLDLGTIANAPAGAGTVTTSGTQTTGYPTAFSSSTAITNVTGHGLALPVDCADTSGSATAQVCNTTGTFTPAPGDCIVYTTTTANTGALTLNVNSLGAKPVHKYLGGALASGDMPANVQEHVCYDGTAWDVPTVGNAPSGSGNLSGTWSTTGNYAVTNGPGGVGDSGIFLGYFDGPATTFTNTSTTVATVITSPTIPAGAHIKFHCTGFWESAVAAEKLAIAILASQTPQSIWYWGSGWDTSSGPLQGNAGGSGTQINISGVATSTTTAYPFEVQGLIIWNASTPGTFAFQAGPSATSATLTIAANAMSCKIN